MRIGKLMRTEAIFLWHTILFMGLILSAFVGALLSVISVTIDVPEGLYRGYDEQIPVFKLFVSDVSADFAVQDGTSRYGTLNGITKYAVLTCKTSLSTTPRPSKKTDGTEDEKKEEVNYALSAPGYALPLATAADTCGYYPVTAANYRYPEKPGEMAINASIAKMIGATIGDTVTISPDPAYADGEIVDLSGVKPQKYTVVGYADTSRINTVNQNPKNEAVLGAAYFYIIPPEGTVYDSLAYSFTSSQAVQNSNLRLQHAGYSVSLDGTTNGVTEHIAIARAFFFAVSFVLGLMVLFILYSLITIFFRQRRSQICRLKLLGARSGSIAAIYCGIAVAMTLVAVLVGTLFSMAFNVYFINLCGELFKVFSKDFVSHFRPWVAALLFAVLTAFIFLMFAAIDRKVKNETIAEEVRHE